MSNGDNSKQNCPQDAANPAPPFRRIARDLHQGSIVPFLGAGASACNRPPQGKWKEGVTTFPPLGGELAEYLASDGSFPDAEERNRRDLPRVASYYEHVAVDRIGLREILRDVFKAKFRPGRLHRYLASITRPLLIITTNYDNLLEQAFEDTNRPFHLVVHPTDDVTLAGSVLWRKPCTDQFEAFAPNELPLSLRDTAIIYKMHGHCDRGKLANDHFLITEEDYVEFLARMTTGAAVPARFKMILRQSRLLFLGYGLRDWNFRILLHNLRTKRRTNVGDEDAEVEQEGTETERESQKGTRRFWAIQYRPTVVERKLWEAQNVSIYDMDLDEFVAKLEEQGK